MSEEQKKPQNEVQRREVLERPERRRFTAEYKADVLRRADACHNPGEIGALLRSEGLYSSCLTKWRQQRELAEIDGLSPKKRGRKPTAKIPLQGRLAELEKENRRLRKRAERAEALVDIQKKVSQMLGIALPDPDEKIE